MRNDIYEYANVNHFNFYSENLFLIIIQLENRVNNSNAQQVLTESD